MLKPMRPSMLDPFFASVRSLSGIGPKIAALLGAIELLKPTVLITDEESATQMLKDRAQSE